MLQVWIVCYRKMEELLWKKGWETIDSVASFSCLATVLASRKSYYEKMVENVAGLGCSANYNAARQRKKLISIYLY